MKNGVSKANSVSFDKKVIEVFTAAFGEPSSYMGSTWGHKEWSFERPDGTVKVTMHMDSLKEGRTYRSRTVFCRLMSTDGAEPYGYSGKNNCHIMNEATHAEAVNQAINHVKWMTAHGTPARAAMDAVEMMPIPDATRKAA